MVASTDEIGANGMGTVSLVDREGCSTKCLGHDLAAGGMHGLGHGCQTRNQAVVIEAQLEGAGLAEVVDDDAPVDDPSPVPPTSTSAPIRLPWLGAVE